MTLIKYIDHLQRTNANDLAFYPFVALELAIEKSRVVTCKENDEYAGYLWHGPIRPGYDTIINQACVDYSARRRELGWQMVRDLIARCQAGHALGIRLRCGSNSDANIFWQAIGFYCTKVSAGGVKRKRDINHWRTDIQAPLFVVDSVAPSGKLIDLRAYDKDRRDGVIMPNRFSRYHYERS